MQLPFNVSARAHVQPRSIAIEPSLDRSTKCVMDDTDGDDEERPAQRVAIHRRRSYTFVIGDTEVSMPWTWHWATYKDRRNAFVLA